MESPVCPAGRAREVQRGISTNEYASPRHLQIGSNANSSERRTSATSKFCALEASLRSEHCREGSRIRFQRSGRGST